MPDPTKKYPIKNKDERRPNQAAGSGQIKQVSDTSGKRYYHKDPDTGKIVEYDATRYVPASSKTTTKPKHEGHSVGSFDHSKDRSSALYMDELFKHTKGATPKDTTTKRGKAVFE